MEFILTMLIMLIFMYLVLSVTVLFIKLLPIVVVAWIFYKLWKKFVQKT